MRVRLKMRCDNVQPDITRENQPPAGAVYLSAVQSNDEGDENQAFWRYTPSGRLEFWTVNEIAMQQFERGKYYYVDITVVEE